MAKVHIKFQTNKRNSRKLIEQCPKTSFLLISITLLPNNGYYAKSHIVQAMNLKQDDSRLPKTS